MSISLGLDIKAKYKLNEEYKKQKGKWFPSQENTHAQAQKEELKLLLFFVSFLLQNIKQKLNHSRDLRSNLKSRSPLCGTVEMNLTSTHEVAGSIPGLSQ